MIDKIYNLLVLFKNINNYGYIVFVKTLFFEFFYSIKFLDFNIFKFDSKKTDDYEFTKVSDNYSTPNIPTPYYFLTIVKKFLLKNNLLKFNLHDFGCGNGRVGNFLNDNFNLNFIGIDLNLNTIIKNRKKFYNKKNFFFYQKDLQKISKNEEIDIFFNTNENSYKDYLLFCSDPFDSKSIINLLHFYKSKNKSFYFLMINQKNLTEFNHFKILNQVFFKNNKRNITLFKL